MNKAIFLDRDGTINVDKHYLYKVEEFELLPGTVEGLQLLQEAGYYLIVITNQSGIARGYFTEEDYRKLTEYMLITLKKKGVILKDVLYCPHLPDAIVSKYRVDCDCRKPKLGLFYKAVKKWDIDLDKSWAIGDKERDCAICKITNCKGIIIGCDNRMHTANNLLEAAKYILEHEK